MKANVSVVCGELQFTKLSTEGDGTALQGMNKVDPKLRIRLSSLTRVSLPESVWINVLTNSLWRISPLSHGGKIGYERINVPEDIVKSVIVKLQASYKPVTNQVKNTVTNQVRKPVRKLLSLKPKVKSVVKSVVKSSGSTQILNSFFFENELQIPVIDL